jgi:uncharacterized PurR-regulated membrane protein YhhQ (DUF165 family)
MKVVAQIVDIILSQNIKTKKPKMFFWVKKII